MRNLAAWRAAMRLARRDAWRHKGRSALIVAMVTIPVLGLSGADVLARTMQLSPGERVTREIGKADVAMVFAGGRVDQTVDPLSGGFSNSFPPGSKHPGGPLAIGSPGYAELRHRALALVDATSATRVDQVVQNVSAHGLRVITTVTQLALNQPVTRGIAAVQSGHPPQNTHQVAVTSRLADRLHLALGDQVVIEGASRTVTAIMRDPIDFANLGVYALPGSINDNGRYAVELVQTAHPVSWQQVIALNAIGVAAASRAVIENPPPGVASYFGHNGLTTRNAVGVETVAIGMAILEVCLLAGAAFAVGARRQRRDLAIVAAAGGDARDVRRVVLSGGVVLGAVGAVAGVGLGVALSPLALPYVAHASNRSPGHFDLRPLELLGIMVLGLVTGILSAVLPARSAAREDVVAALAGRRGVLRTARRIPIIGIAMIILGVVIAYRATLNFHFRIILAGAVLSQLGFVLCAPALVGLVSRLGRFLGLAPRLALRDAARHRGRSGPAVAAIMSAVAGTIAVSTYFVTSEHNDRRDYTPEARIGQPALWLYHDRTPAQLAAIDDTLRRDVRASRVVSVPTVDCIHVAGRCPHLDAQAAFGFPSVAVGGPELLRTLIQRVDPAAERALNAGRPIIFARSGVGAPTQLGYGSGYRPPPGLAARYVVGVGERGAAVPALISPATAAALDARTSMVLQIAVTAGQPSSAEIDLANGQLPTSSSLVLDTGYHSRYDVGVIVLAIAAAIVMLAATAVSVGLSMAESKPDLVTLAAVGSRPSTRRLLVASQAGTVSLLGATQGVVAGLIPAWAVLHALRRPGFTLPWMSMLVIVVGIPLLAMAVAAAFAGTRLTLTRRLT